VRNCNTWQQLASATLFLFHHDLKFPMQLVSDWKRVLRNARSIQLWMAASPVIFIEPFVSLTGAKLLVADRAQPQ